MSEKDEDSTKIFTGLLNVEICNAMDDARNELREHIYVKVENALEWMLHNISVMYPEPDPSDAVRYLTQEILKIIKR